MTDIQRIKNAEQLLRQARDLLVLASAPRAAEKVRRAIKSVGGAIRNAQVRDARAD